MKCLRASGVLLGVLLTFCSLSILGCGDGLPNRVPVSGHAFFDGKPLEGGAVGIYTPGQRASSATIGPGGAFTVSTFSTNDGLMPGKHQVVVVWKEDVGSNAIRWMIPKKYADPETSGLEINITGPTSDIKLELTSEPGKKYPWVEKFK